MNTFGEIRTGGTRRNAAFSREFLGLGPVELNCPHRPRTLGWSRWGSGISSPCCHLFVDDYRFDVVWRDPEKGLRRALAFGTVTVPDFSIFPGVPHQVANWQAWRSAVVGAYWQANGLDVLPVAQWGDVVPAPYITRGSWLAVRGPQRGQDREAYAVGARTVASLVSPSGVLIVGNRAFADAWGKAEKWVIACDGGDAERITGAPVRVSGLRKGRNGRA